MNRKHTPTHSDHTNREKEENSHYRQKIMKEMGYRTRGKSRNVGETKVLSCFELIGENKRTRIQMRHSNILNHITNLQVFTDGGKSQLPSRHRAKASSHSKDKNNQRNRVREPAKIQVGIIRIGQRYLECSEGIKEIAPPLKHCKTIHWMKRTKKKRKGKRKEKTKEEVQSLK